MSKFKIKKDSGEIDYVEGFKFSHYIGHYRHWFGVHKDAFGHSTITQIASGMKVGLVPSIKLAAGYSVKDAAKSFIDEPIGS